MGFVNDIKFWIIGTYNWLKIKYLAWKYDIDSDKIFYAYIHLYHHFPTLIMILKRCRDEDRDFDREVESAIEAKEMIEDFVKNEGD